MVVPFAVLVPLQLVLHSVKLQMSYCWAFSRSFESRGMMWIERSRGHHADLSITCMSRHKLTLRWTVSEHVVRVHVSNSRDDQRHVQPGPKIATAAVM